VSPSKRTTRLYPVIVTCRRRKEPHACTQSLLRVAVDKDQTLVPSHCYVSPSTRTTRLYPVIVTCRRRQGPHACTQSLLRVAVDKDHTLVPSHCYVSPSTSTPRLYPVSPVHLLSTDVPKALPWYRNVLTPTSLFHKPSPPSSTLHQLIAVLIILYMTHTTYYISSSQSGISVRGSV
jgi:hypothetical protein